MKRAMPLLAVVVILGSACSEARSSRIVAVWFDISRSTAEHRAEFLTDFEQVVSSLEGGDHIVVGVIDRSMTRASLILDEAVPEFSALRDNTVEHRHEMETFKKRLVASVSETITRVPSKWGTDVVGALELSEQIFAAYSGIPRRSLVLFTDGEQTAGVDVVAPRRERLARVIAALRRAGRVPDLHGVELRMVGIGQSKRELSFTEAERVREFWFAFAAAARADMSAAGYGQRLLAWR